MKTTVQYLDALKAKTGAGSDYALAPKLGVTRAAISNYRNGRSFFDDEMCLKVASLLEIKPFIVMADIHAERAKTEPEKSAWRAASEAFAKLVTITGIGIMLSAPTPSHANTGAGAESAKQQPDLYIIRNRKRRTRRNNAFSMLLENLLPSPKFA